MIIRGLNSLNEDFDTCIIPFYENPCIFAEINAQIKKVIEKVICSNLFSGKTQEIYTTNVLVDDKLKNIVLIGLGVEIQGNRSAFLAFSSAFSSCDKFNSEKTAVLIDNIKEISDNYNLFEKICESAILADYNFDYYKSTVKEKKYKETIFVSNCLHLDSIILEATNVANSTLIARDLCNHPAMYMTPGQIVKDVLEIGKKSGFSVEVLDKSEIEKLGMGSFLAVGKGSKNPPFLIVMRYENGGDNCERIALVGKGVMYDSGGFSLKSDSSMMYMYNDMGGAAAVVGAMQAIAKMKIKANVVGIIAACENILSRDAFLPGDILTSMSGKTIQMLNTDAEGRLTLIDAITYAIRNEKADKIIDIATLTGAAKGALGNKTAVAVSNNDELCDALADASVFSCEKTWRLPADKELRPILNSDVADIKSCSPGNTVGGGSIVASLFIEEFVENKPWLHLDIAATCWSRDKLPYSKTGATGFGTSLLYNLIKLMLKNN